MEYNYDKTISQIPEEISIEAVIISEGNEEDYKYTYTIQVNTINGKILEKKIKLILNLKKNKIKNEIPKFGDVVLITGTYEKANVARNYKGFDYRQYLKSKKIYGTVDCEKYEIIYENKMDSISTIINYVQKNIKENMSNILDEEQGALCVGILIGNREDISDKTEDNFKKSNLTHLLAVSGSHISYIVVALTTLLGKTNRKFSIIFTIFFLIIFMMITGFTASVMRASIMGILTLIANILHRKADTINNLGISSIIILILNPYLLIDAGFLLSYAGTIGIVFFSDKITNILNNILHIDKKMEVDIEKVMENYTTEKDGVQISEYNKSYTGEEFKDNKKICVSIITILKKIVSYLIVSFSITISANIVIIPIMAYMFSTVSITFWISNILAGPVMEVVTISGFITYFISLIFPIFAEFLGIFLNILLTILLKIAEISSNIPGSSIYIQTPSIMFCIGYYLIIIGWYNIKSIKRFCNRNNFKFLGIIVSFIIILNSIIKITDRKLQIHFVDVGQGDCTLIQTPKGSNILIDGGGSEFGNFDVGESILLPYLLDRGVTKIDYMMISHFDSDHIGGLFYIIENIQVDNIIISKQGENSENFKKFIETISKNRTNIIIVKKGDYVKIDSSSYFEILFPEENLIQENILNNNSIVAKFVTKNLTLLFTGDIEQIAENRLCKLYKNTNKLSADIIKIAHHGSKTSTTDGFLELVKPKIALIGVGEDNNFGHPSKEVLERIKACGTKIYRTDQCGEISIVVKNNGGIKVKQCIE